jgi:hypothetical protein
MLTLAQQAANPDRTVGGKRRRRKFGVFQFAGVLESRPATTRHLDRLHARRFPTDDFAMLLVRVDCVILVGSGREC